MSLAFKIGDQAVYAGHGVGVITAIETREISGNTQTFYAVRIKDSEMNILVPKSRIGENGGLRPVASRQKALEVLSILKGKEMTMKGANNWNKKIQEYMKKLKTGSLLEAASVLKDLCLMKAKKNLSFGEKQLMETAWNLIYKEISMVFGPEESQNLLSSATGVHFQSKH